MQTLNVSQMNGNKGLYNYKHYYNNYMLQMGLIAKGMYTYDNIGVKDLDTRFIENALYYYGKMGFTKDKKIGFVGSPVCENGVINNYDLPLSYTFMGNVYKEECTNENIEIMRANLDSIPIVQIVSMFAERLANLDKTEDIRVYQLRKPYIITCKESQRVSVEILFNRIDNFEKLVIADKDIETYGINTIPLDVPYDLDKLDEHKANVWNDFYTFLGINNANTTKRERLIKDEVNANNQGLNIIMQSAFECRQDACNRINEHFGTNIKVRKTYEVEATDTLQIGSDEND